MRVSLDGKLMASQPLGRLRTRNQSKAGFSFLVPSTVWIDDVKIWKVR